MALIPLKAGGVPAALFPSKCIPSFSILLWFSDASTEPWCQPRVVFPLCLKKGATEYQVLSCLKSFINVSVLTLLGMTNWDENVQYVQFHSLNLSLQTTNAMKAVFFPGTKTKAAERNQIIQMCHAARGSAAVWNMWATKWDESASCSLPLTWAARNVIFFYTSFIYFPASICAAIETLNSQHKLASVYCPESQGSAEYSFVVRWSKLQ